MRRTLIVKIAALTQGLVLLLVAGLAAAAARDYRLDPVHTRVWFTVQHLKFSQAMGSFRAPRGWLRFDPEDWQSAQAEIEIDLATLDLGEPDWNRKILGKDWLDDAKQPVARFVSRSVVPIDAEHFRLLGDLQLRGRSIALELDVTLNALGRHPLTLRRTAGFSARGTISRSALGMKRWPSMVADQVQLHIEVEAQRKRRPPAAAVEAKEIES